MSLRKLLNARWQDNIPDTGMEAHSVVGTASLHRPHSFECQTSRNQWQFMIHTPAAAYSMKLPGQKQQTGEKKKLKGINNPPNTTV